MQRGIVQVVDDDSSIRWVLECAFVRTGLTRMISRNGAGALEVLTSGAPGTLLSDVRMPGVDKLVLFKQIK